MTARTDECLLCGDPFVVTPRHPMAESAWCPDCWAVLAERMALGVDGWGYGWRETPALRWYRV